MYSLVRNLLFCLPAEASHSVTLPLLDLAKRTGLIGLISAGPIPPTPVTAMGLTFSNPVGLAAGLDKNADHIDALGALGFGFLEVGTLTPRPQPGNPKPRLFRLAPQHAIINRMGFNNKGIDHALASIARSSYRGVLGINIGKNFDTPVENAADDYLICMRKCYSAASYIVVNLSSPNTPGLRSLQFGDDLRRLLSLLKTEQATLTQIHGKKVPLAVKIAPDLDDNEVRLIASALLDNEIEGVIATNTTLDRGAVQDSPWKDQAGGLSGAPLTGKSTHVIRVMKEAVGDAIPIIGVGGILSGEDARAKIDAGACLVQIYTGFIYRGPELISESVAAIAVSRQ
ncbi:MAG: quinone-dependent dihydroorotate dehydrogenase [Gammaproteobacteria bacterium]|nr:quinone-dependent dihydroorotate dehydrogenase [Gammaproteobacteria bacterium]MDP2139205.1 quinone-dependent dihydroorotate dehydrogenase [Gammaproteobacteria bacterium]MDP2349026.1 quinone-dependent dihydroorotate dehydrogenase [Gammaproteobacteria bacterium]